MKIPTLFTSTIALTLILGAVGTSNAIAAPALTEESRLGTNGIGPVRVGMTVNEAEAASGRKFKRYQSYGESCTYVSPIGIDGLSFMVIRGIIERVDINSSRMFTLRGAKIGDSETRIKQLYPGQIKTTPHPYTYRVHTSQNWANFHPMKMA